MNGAASGGACWASRCQGDDLEEDAERERIGREFVAYRLNEESDIVRQIYQRAGAQGGVALDEVETVVASLSVAMHAEGQLLLPMLEFPGQDAANALHAINVSLLAMTLGESLGMASHDVHAVGSAALLHDVGISGLPQELLGKPALSPEERLVIEAHPEIGARMLFARSAVFDLAAIVCYEHHMRPDGTGFPRTRFPREMHYCSKIVAVCDVYDALRTPRAYRPGVDAAARARVRRGGNRHDVRCRHCARLCGDDAAAGGTVAAARGIEYRGVGALTSRGAPARRANRRAAPPGAIASPHPPPISAAGLLQEPRLEPLLFPPRIPVPVPVPPSPSPEDPAPRPPVSW